MNKYEYVLVQNSEDINKYYKINEKNELGSGSYGKVIKSVHLKTGEVRAIKVIPKRKVKNKERFKSEVDILRSMNHPNIIKLYEVFEDEHNVYLIFEICEGGELFDRIIERGYFSEMSAITIFKQIMKSLDYCHKSGICHRDLKPENFLFSNKSDDSVVKLIDFGLSKVYRIEDEVNKKLENFAGRRNSNNMKTKAGTPYYIAPEVLTGKYDEKCDIWSAGVILYILLCGYPPFYGNTDPQILEAVKKGTFEFDGEEWDGVSATAKDLINKMLCRYDKRLSAEEVLAHPWMQQKDTIKNNIKIDNLKKYIKDNNLKKSLLNVIAGNLDSNGFDDIVQIFSEIDKNNDGKISLDEFTEGFIKLKLGSKSDAVDIFKAFDFNGNNFLDWNEFLAGVLSHHTYLKENKINEFFNKLDKNGDQMISKDELKDILKGDSELIKNFDEYDLNKDGYIDKDEFFKIFINRN